MPRFPDGISVAAGLFVLGCAGLAHADGMLGTPPASPPNYYWSGLYTGLNAGAAFGSYDPQTATSPGGTFGKIAITDLINSLGDQSIKPLGFIGGVEAGYNWQSGAWVAGIEADLSYLHLNGAATTFISFAPVNTNTAVMGAYGNANGVVTLRPRVGWAVDHWLLYATGGLALADIADDFVFSGVDAAGKFFYQQSSRINSIQIGYAAGGGIEMAINERWSARAEYLHLGFGRATATQTATDDPTQVITQSALLNADIVRFGLDYRWNTTESAYTLPLAFKAPQSTVTIWNKSDWQIDVGTRAALSGGTIGSPQPLLNNPQILASRLVWSGMDAVTGETYGRIDHASGWFVKGFLGAGGIFAGHLNDEDFPASTGGGYSNTYSSSRGDIGYANIDLGYSLLKSQDAKLGAFVGYNYYSQHANSFGCTQIAGSTECHGTAPNFLVISEDDKFNSLRLGLTAEYLLTDRLKFVGDAAYLPYVSFSGLDDHNGRALALYESASGGNGAMLEALLSYSITNSWNVGVGARYWAWTTRYGTEIFDDHIFGAAPPSTEPARFMSDRYGVFAQAGYHWGDPAIGATVDAPMAIKAPVIAASPTNWTGFYFGGHVGGGYSEARWADPFGATISPSGEVNVPGFGDVTDATGPLGGGQLGVNWQTGQWVLGLEGLASIANLIGNNTCFSGLGGINCEHVVNDVTEITGRAGYAWNSALVYVKAGSAWANTTYDLNANTHALKLGTGSTGVNDPGWVVGVGLEYALTDHWTTRFEYDHVGLDSANPNFPTVAKVNAQSIGIQQTIDTARLAVNYKL